MKFSLIAAVVLLALAQASFAQDAANIDIAQMVEEFKNKMTQDISELVRNRDLANQAQTFMEEKRTQLEPLASQIQEQVKAAMTQIEEQMKPFAANAQAQFQPMVEKLQKQMEDFLQTLNIGN